MNEEYLQCRCGQTYERQIRAPVGHAIVPEAEDEVHGENGEDAAHVCGGGDEVAVRAAPVRHLRLVLHRLGELLARVDPSILKSMYIFLTYRVSLGKGFTHLSPRGSVRNKTTFFV